MGEIVVNTTLLAGLFAYWCSQLADNDNLKITEIVAIVEHLPVTQGGYQLLRSYLATMSDDILAIERMLEDFADFMTFEEIESYYKHLKNLTGSDDDDTLDLCSFDECIEEGEWE